MIIKICWVCSFSNFLLGKKECYLLGIYYTSCDILSCEKKWLNKSSFLESLLNGIHSWDFQLLGTSFLWHLFSEKQLRALVPNIISSGAFLWRNFAISNISLAIFKFSYIAIHNSFVKSAKNHKKGTNL